MSFKTEEKQAVKKIGIDCRLLGKKHAGIGRYIENLLSYIAKQKFSTPYSWTFFFYDAHQYNEFLKTPGLEKKFFQQHKIVFAPVRHYSLDEQLRMPGIFSEANLDLLHVPHFNIPLFYPGKLIVTIHDLLWHEFRGRNVTTLSSWKYWLKHWGYRFITAQAIKKAELIIVPTATIKSTVVRFFPNSSEKVIITYEGADPTFLTADTGHLAKTSKQLVYVGSLYPHKNVQIVLQALRELPDYNLQIVGSRNIFQDNTKELAIKLGVKDQVVFRGYLSDQELVKLFQKSLALIQPSLSEGFGLTGIEALATGLPVIASNIPIFQEVYQDHATYFNPHVADDLVKKINQLSVSLDPSDRKKRQQFVREKYDWATMTSQVTAIYQKALV